MVAAGLRVDFKCAWSTLQSKLSPGFSWTSLSEEAFAISKFPFSYSCVTLGGEQRAFLKCMELKGVCVCEAFCIKMCEMCYCCCCSIVLLVLQHTFDQIMNSSFILVFSVHEMHKCICTVEFWPQCFTPRNLVLFMLLDIFFKCFLFFFSWCFNAYVWI